MDGLTMHGRSSARRDIRLACALLLGMAACGGAARGGMGGSLTPDLIQRSEIDASPATNAYELISQVRPNWLRGRGAPNLRSGPELPIVYLEDRRQGGLEVLRSFVTSGIAEIRFISATAATTRYGDGHGGGIIQIVLRER